MTLLDLSILIRLPRLRISHFRFDLTIYPVVSGAHRGLGRGVQSSETGVQNVKEEKHRLVGNWKQCRKQMRYSLKVVQTVTRERVGGAGGGGTRERVKERRLDESHTARICVRYVPVDENANEFRYYHIHVQMYIQLSTSTRLPYITLPPSILFAAYSISSVPHLKKLPNAIQSWYSLS
jgi:hypothetical protein